MYVAASEITTVQEYRNVHTVMRTVDQTDRFRRTDNLTATPCNYNKMKTTKGRPRVPAEKRDYAPCPLFSRKRCLINFPYIFVPISSHLLTIIANVHHFYF